MALGSKLRGNYPCLLILQILSLFGFIFKNYHYLVFIFVDTRLAQLAYIASILEPREESADNISEYYGMHLGPIAMSAAKMLHTYLVDVLTSKNSDVLVYDISFGGIITKNGFQDSMEDFGNGW
jgi:hypothetical protein